VCGGWGGGGVGGGVGCGIEWCGRPGGKMGDEMNILNKKNDFMR